MSYSYVKTVFPNFAFSNVYNDNLYTNTTPNTPLNVTGLDNTQNNYSTETYKQIEPYKQIETYKQIEPYTQIDQEEPYKNNLTYYNKPVLNQDIPHYQNINHQESFESTIKDKTNASHDEYLNHINSCPGCKELLLKQLNIETERLRNDEIMELLSYIVFGIFILILLDSLKK